MASFSLTLFRKLTRSAYSELSSTRSTALA
jgi:hypothetical protein